MKQPNELDSHIFSTYKNLRWGMAGIAAAFPLLLFGLGRLYGIGLQDSMSAYYFAEAGGEAPMRIWFVGILFVLAAFLYLYKGFSDTENIALNMTALFAFGVALFPMEWGCGERCNPVTIHGACAVALFVCIAFVAIWCANDTLPLLKNPALEARYRKLYRWLGALMIVSPLLAFVLTLVLDEPSKYIFFAEAAGILAFAGYWAVKSWELWQNQAEQRALSQALEATSIAGQGDLQSSGSAV